MSSHRIPSLALLYSVRSLFGRNDVFVELYVLLHEQRVIEIDLFVSHMLAWYKRSKRR